MVKTKQKIKFERIVKFSQPFDKRSDIRGENYGIGSMRIWFILKGRHGAVQVCFNTPFYLPKTIDEYKRIGNKNKTIPSDIRDEDGKAKGFDCWDVGYHSPKPMFEGQTKTDCDLLRKGFCYYDGSGLRGNNDGLPELFYEKGDEAIWEYLEDYYYEIFNIEQLITTPSDSATQSDKSEDLI